jgi:hypothetical protein
MATYERQIDALGGVPEGSGEYNAGYYDGYSRAVEEATAIGADADDTINELIEAITDVLEGRFDHRGLQRWAENAEALVSRINRRLA